MICTYINQTTPINLVFQNFAKVLKKQMQSNANDTIW